MSELTPAEAQQPDGEERVLLMIIVSDPAVFDRVVTALLDLGRLETADGCF